LVSAFGARFDVEVDALFLLILALLVWQSGKVDAWILTIGLMRYAFVLASSLYPLLRRPLPESRRRKAVCVMQGVALFICLLPPIAPLTASMVAVIALAGLVASFATDVRWLLGSHQAGVSSRRVA
jgi:phosphatidylglycerophosphate synthase